MEKKKEEKKPKKKRKKHHFVARFIFWLIKTALLIVTLGLAAKWIEEHWEEMVPKK